jgi:hypothetical protein
MNDDITAQAKPGLAYTAGPDLWARVPEFTYALPGASWAVARTAPSGVLLLMWFAAAVWFASRATRRLAAG